MGAAAIPIVAAVIGAGGGAATAVYSAKKQGDYQKKAIKAQKEGQYAFSEQERAMARQYLMRSLTMRMPQAPRPGTQGVPGNATPQQIQFAQFMKMIQDRYSRPSPEYQGYLQGLQERRDARGGVPLPPPQGATAPSAQRRNPNAVAGYGGGRSY